MEGAGFDRKCADEAVALVGHAGATLGVRVVGILHRGGRAGDQSILAIVDGVGISVGEAQIRAVGQAAVDGEGCAVVNAGRGALKFVNGAQLRDRSAERIDARRKRAGGRNGVLPGGEGIDRVVSALEDGAGGIENGIGKGARRRQIYVESADQVFTVHIEIRDGDGSLVRDFAFQGEAHLLHPRGDEVGGESRNVIGDALREPGGKIAGRGSQRATYQRIGVGGEDLMVVEVGVVEKNLRVADAVLGGDGRVVDLRNANVEHSITRADDERVRPAEGVGESGARAEVVRIEGNFARGREQRIRD